MCRSPELPDCVGHAHRERVITICGKLALAETRNDSADGRNKILSRLTGHLPKHVGLFL